MSACENFIPFALLVPNYQFLFCIVNIFGNFPFWREKVQSRGFRGRSGYNKNTCFFFIWPQLLNPLTHTCHISHCEIESHTVK